MQSIVGLYPDIAAEIRVLRGYWVTELADLAILSHVEKVFLVLFLLKKKNEKLSVKNKLSFLYSLMRCKRIMGYYCTPRVAAVTWHRRINCRALPL